MANLTGTMSSIGGVNLDTEASIKYSEMVTAFGKEMLLQYGYVSQWEWYAEMLPCANIEPHQTGEYEKVKALLAKTDVTEDDRLSINSFVSRIGSYNMANHPDAGKAWAAFSRYSLSWVSPFFKYTPTAYVYGWPNTLANDPRRTGKVIVFKDTSQYFEWLLENSYKYGFVWYGPDDNTFIYVGQTTVFSPDFIAAASLGLKAPLYNIYKVAHDSKAPTSKQEVVDWVASLPLTGYISGQTAIPKASLEKSWIAWELFMNKVA